MEIGIALSRRNAHRAFTVLELIVVTAIIGGLIALLLPALMAAREAARNVQCLSNLRQIGMAMQLHHNATNCLPGAWISERDKSYGYGWAVALMPYLEQAALRKTIRCDLPVSASENDMARSADWQLMRCPSDISERSFELFAENSRRPELILAMAAGTSPPASSVSELPIRLPTANYLGVYGTAEADDAYPPPPGDGAIVIGRPVRFVDLQRGQSNTLILGERTTARAPSTWLGVDFRGEDAACRLVGSAITAPNCSDCDECEFASRHPDGANFVWADGHAGNLSNDIDTREYQRLAKRRAY